jgi:hypothetical protein
LPVAVTQAQRVDEERVAVLAVQRADELFVVRHVRLSAPAQLVSDLFSITR